MFNSKQIIIVGSVMVAAWVTYSTVSVKQSATHIADMKSEIKTREQENLRLKQDIASLKRRISALNDRPEAQERQIRDELGLIRKDEVIYSFPQEGE